MSYSLEFKESALKEWKKLDGGIREQFKKKLDERLDTPRVPSAKLSGHADRYKIKLRSIGFRLVGEQLLRWVSPTAVIAALAAKARMMFVLGKLYLQAPRLDKMN